MTDMNQLNELARRQELAEEKVAFLTQRLKDARAELRELAEKELPDALGELGLEEYRTTSGLVVRVKHGLAVSETGPGGKYHEPIVAWLRESGNADLITNAVTVYLSRGEDEEARALADQLRARYQNVSSVRTFHASSLKALIRELLNEGGLDPETIGRLGVVRWRRTELNRVEDQPTKGE